MRKKICKKLRSQTGESIAETLIAVLVIAVATMLLAGMITATNNMVRQSKEKANEYYQANTVLETFDGTVQSAEIKITAAVDPTDTDMKPVFFSIPDVSVTCAENATFGSNPVVAYHRTGS